MRVVFVRLRWQNITKQWTMTVQDESGGDIVTNIPLISNIEPLTGNLLRVYGYKEIGELHIIPKDDSLWGIDPTRRNLKDNYYAVWGDKDE